MKRHKFRSGLASAFTAVWLLPGCTTTKAPETSPLPAEEAAAVPVGPYFAPVDPSDGWEYRISQWQRRQAAEDKDTLTSAHTELNAKYQEYRAEKKREFARDLTQWIQDIARNHYVPDGLVDHWATLSETLRRNGDDCDGLELLTRQTLLDMGFGKDEVFRAIVVRDSDGQHHMVTLWFETPGSANPWVLDPTGGMISEMKPMQEVEGWTPLRIFSEDQSFAVSLPFHEREGQDSSSSLSLQTVPVPAPAPAPR